MTSSAATFEWIVKQISGADEITAKKMFGKFGFYCDDKIIGLVCDNQFFVKRTEEEMSNKAKLAQFLQITYKHLPKQKKLRCAQ